MPNDPYRPHSPNHVLVDFTRESVEDRSVSKALAISGLVVSLLLLLIFGLDLAIAIPFGRSVMVMDIGFVISALLLAYMSWSTFR